MLPINENTITHIYNGKMEQNKPNLTNKTTWNKNKINDFKNNLKKCVGVGWGAEGVSNWLSDLVYVDTVIYMAEREREKEREGEGLKHVIFRLFVKRITGVFLGSECRRQN